MGALTDFARGGRARTPRRAPVVSVPYGPQQPVVPGGSHGRSVLSAGETAFTRLLQALRSNAPGGWSDDRYEQTQRHFTGITYVAIHRLSMQMSRAEFQVYRSDDAHPDGKRPVTRKDPPTSRRYAELNVRPWDLVELLKKPNNQDTFGRLMYRWTQQKLLTGSALTWMVPNRLQHPYELYSIPTALAIPQPAVNPEYPQGFYRIQPVYPYGPFSSFPAPASSVGAPIGGQWMMRMFYPHPLLRYEGYSPQTGMRLHIDSIEMIDRARHYMMRRGIYPSAVLNGTDAEGAAELDDTQIEQLRAMFEAEHMGPENMGRLFVAYAGWKLEQWGQAPADMAFEGGWEQLMGFILGGGFGISSPAAGMVETSSYQTLFATMKQLHLTTLEPEAEDIGATLTRTLGPFFGDDLIVQVRCPRIDDHELKFSKLGLAMQGKCMTKNELRHELDLPMTHEPWGADIAGEPPQQQGAPGMPGIPGAGGPPQGAEVMTPADAEGQGDDADPLAALLAVSDEPAGPDAGALAEGSLGPQPGTVQAKRLGQFWKHLRRPSGANGNGRH